MAFYTFLLLPTALRFDFRRDLDRLATLKGLPITPAAAAIGQTLAPVLIATAFQGGVLTWHQGWIAPTVVPHRPAGSRRDSGESKRLGIGFPVTHQRRAGQFLLRLGDVRPEPSTHQGGEQAGRIAAAL